MFENPQTDEDSIRFEITAKREILIGDSVEVINVQLRENDWLVQVVKPFAFWAVVKICILEIKVANSSLAVYGRWLRQVVQ